MGKPHHRQLEAPSHPKHWMSRVKNTRPSFPPSSHQPYSHSHLLPQKLTDGCMTMAKSPKLDLSYHLTFVWRMSRDLGVTHRAPSSHHAQCLVPHTPPLWESALSTFRHHSDYSVTALWVLDLSWWQFHFLESKGSLGVVSGKYT